MFKNSDDLFRLINKKDLKVAIKSGSIGIEKESLRILNSIISQRPHRDILGAPLHHRFITTDFSDAQVEFITPPFPEKKESFDFLTNLHHFVIQNIGEEYLWPFSIPPMINDHDIPIAEFGNTNEALFKKIYRQGLSHRYGKVMQTISGLHFNYSLPASFWELNIFNESGLKKQDIRSNIYFRALRNIERMNWLILYLFGCSPILPKNLINQNYNFIRLNNDEYYLPYATSLRMSDLGYQNINQADLYISLDTLEKYTSDLKNATDLRSKEFEKIDNELGLPYSQINQNVLQIEDEYYAISRPKSISNKGRRQANKLVHSGVDYIELRSLDLNPFSKNGIEIEDLNFLEIFTLYCTLKPSMVLSKPEINQVKKNNLLVATEGRRPNLKLQKGKQNLSLKKWANEIINEMSLIAEITGNNLFNMQKYKDMILYPESTPSGILIEKILQEKISFKDLGQSLAEDYRATYFSIEPKDNPLWKKLIDEKEKSLLELKRNEEYQEVAFDKYLKDYFA